MSALRDPVVELSLIDRLAKYLEQTPALPRADARNAAVACVLDDEPGGPRVLLMKRAEREGDPWSGHISLPGGGYHAHEDADLLATAIRETREELGVDLAGARLLGRLPVLHPRTSGHGIEVTPFVFHTAHALEPVCGPEALAAFWLPLDLAASGQLDSEFVYSPAMKFPAWTYEGHVIWGLTMRILADLLAIPR